jgi:hypothetical protein
VAVAAVLATLLAGLTNDPPIHALPPAIPTKRSADDSTPPKAPVTRLSLAEFVKDAQKLASLRKGVKKMRELKSTDPRSWVFQANIHWRPFFPVYVYTQAEKSDQPAQQLFRDDPGFAPDPNVFNQCPHGNWWFLPWHRAYLFYFERILQWAAEDPTLTLPYWNYSDPDQRELPVAFRTPKSDKAGKIDNPLYLPESASFTDAQGQPQVFLMRDGPMLRGVTQLTASATSLRALSIIPFTNAKPLPANTGFGSPEACDATCGCGPGALESIPHNRIHVAIGGSSALAGGTVRIGFMGDPATAARDPIFWLHHSNIDRLWASWVALNMDRNNPQDPDWLQYPFTFFDVDKDGKTSAVNITPQDLLTTEQLGYKYDKLEPAPPAVASIAALPAAARAGRTFMPLAATAKPGKADVKPHELMTPAGIQLSTAKSLTVPIPAVKDVAPERLHGLLTGKPEDGKGAVIVSIEGVEFAQLPGVDYEVYLNLPANAKPSPESPYHIGTMTFFGRHPEAGTGHAKHAAPVNFKFAISPELGQMLAGAKKGVGEMQVTFVPQNGTEPIPGKAEIAPAANRPGVTIRQVRLLHVR